jgi:hypothetical protein
MKIQFECWAHRKAVIERAAVALRIKILGGERLSVRGHNHASTEEAMCRA